MTLKKDLLNSTEKNILDNLLQSGHSRRKAEEQLFNTYSYLIKEGIHKHTLSEDESFDAYADAILAVINTVVNGSFEGRSSLKTFVYQVYQNKCIDQVRKKSAVKNKVYQTFSITEMITHLSDSAKSVIQSMIDKTDIDILKTKLNELGQNCSQLLLLSADGYTDKEIALTLEYKSADVAKTSRLRCLEKLRKLYTSI